MKFSYLLLATTLCLSLSCSHWSSHGKRSFASLDGSQIQLFKDQGEMLALDSSPENLSFADPASKERSLKQIMSFIEENKEALIGDNHFPLFFDPASYNNIHSDQDGTALRLTQALKVKNIEGEMTVPFEGAELVVLIKNGKIVSLNSSLISEGFNAEPLKTASLEDLKESTQVDHFALLNAISLNPETDDQNFALEALETNIQKKEEKTNFIKRFIQKKNQIFNFVFKAKHHTSGTVKLVMAKRSEASPYEAFWHLDSPLRQPVQIYLSANKNHPVKFVKSTSKIIDAKVKIYRGILLNLDLLRIRSKDSEDAFDDKLRANASDAKEALVNLARVVEYYKSNFGWNSYDNKGSTVKATVKLVSILAPGMKENAAWAQAPYNQFIFGKGGKTLSNFTGALDVIGHEYFHSIVNNTANLNSDAQSGALNEHVSDIFGVGFESEIKKLPYDQKIGEDVIVANKNRQEKIGLRDFMNPSTKSFNTYQADSMNDVEKRFPKTCKPSEDNDRCGIHFSNGALNKAVGTFIQNHGWDKTKKIAYNVVTKRLRSSSDFMDYRNQMLAECASQLSELECRDMEKSFSDIGLVASSPVPVKESETPDLCESIKKNCLDLKASGLELEICKKCGY